MELKCRRLIACLATCFHLKWATSIAEKPTSAERRKQDDGTTVENRMTRAISKSVAKVYRNNVVHVIFVVLI